MQNKVSNLPYTSKTNWYVITGGPSSGKTTMINLLKARGYKTTVELARSYLDAAIKEGHTPAEVRGNQIEFQSRVLAMQIDMEQKLNPTDIVFMDRAIPDDLAYFRFLNIPENAVIKSAMESVSYKKVFILDCLPLVNDYARNEDVIAQNRIHELLVEVYSALPSPIVQVPILPIAERLEFILSHI